MGRWTKRDPSGYHNDATLYVYLGSRPSGSVDPLGLDDSFATDTGDNCDRSGRIARCRDYCTYFAAGDSTVYMRCMAGCLNGGNNCAYCYVFDDPNERDACFAGCAFAGGNPPPSNCPPGQALQCITWSWPCIQTNIEGCYAEWAICANYKYDLRGLQQACWDTCSRMREPQQYALCWFTCIMYSIIYGPMIWGMEGGEFIACALLFYECMAEVEDGCCTRQGCRPNPIIPGPPGLY